MKRNINITIDQSKNQQDSIFINEIPSIVNYSCDSIFLDCLEYISEKDLPLIIKVLSEKLRPKGKLIIHINNVDSIIQQFIKKSISHSDLLKFFANKQNLISVDTIYTLIDFQNFELIECQFEQTFIKLIIERNNL